MPGQLVLPVRLADEASFGNFLVCDSNRLCVARLRSLLERPRWTLLLHGAGDSGRSHLLAASCQHLEQQGADTAYFPLAELRDCPPAELFAGLETRALVCLDDIDAVIGMPDWEEALFHLYNRIVENATGLLLAARKPPADLGIVLPDLRSRLQAALVLGLSGLADEEKLLALQLRAHDRGMTLEPEVARFILQRSARGMGSLIATLDRLDSATLEAGRRISIPFVKSVLEQDKS